MNHIWVVECLFKDGTANWKPTTSVGLTQVEAKKLAQKFKKANNGTVKVRVVLYMGGGHE